MVGNRSKKSRVVLQLRLEEVVRTFIHRHGEKGSSNPRGPRKNYQTKEEQSKVR
jgi:hypothetical protein